VGSFHVKKSGLSDKIISGKSSFEKLFRKNQKQFLQFSKKVIIEILDDTGPQLTFLKYK
jgi:hypothetical protein